MDRLLTLSEEEYLLIEDALGANARGRAFLRIRDQRSRAIAADEVKRLVRGLMAESRTESRPPVEAGNSAHIRILRQELQEMSVYIQQTRSEIAALRPDDSGNNRIMAATGELDAIVTATERATSDILNAAERINSLAARLPRDGEAAGIAEEIEGQAIEILTACSFQDITGQRTTKVVNTLRYLEKRVNSMIEIWGIDQLATAAELGPDGDTRPDAHLLNGPSSEGVSQDDVDALLAEFNAVAPPVPAEPAPKSAPAKPPARPKQAPKAAEPARPAAIAAPPVTAAAAKAAAAAAPAKAAVNGSGGEINQNDVDALFN